MRRYALRDDQWDRIKDFLPGREGHVGARRLITGYLSRRLCIGIERVFHGATCPIGLAIGRLAISASIGGRRPAFLSAFSSCWPVTMTMNT
jgi:hypothetical protein